jgi:hypothetical protein
MSAAPAGSMLNQVWLRLNLQDGDLLLNAERAYSSIPVCAFGSNGRTSAANVCQLRQPSSSLCLAVPVAKTIVFTPRDVAKMAFDSSVIGRIYNLVSGATQAPAQKIADRPELVRQGAGRETLIFEELDPVGVLPSDLSQEGLHFGSLVKLGALTRRSEKVSIWLKGPAASKPAALRIVHWDDRYRNRKISRSIVPGDRIILKEEGTGKLLARKRITEDHWEVDFGISDDVLWRVSLPV